MLLELLVLLMVGSGIAQDLRFPPGYGVLHSCTVDALKTRYTCVAERDIRSYQIGAVWIFQVPESNAGPAQLQIGILPAKPIRRTFAQLNPFFAHTGEPYSYIIKDVVAYDLPQGRLIGVVYDGTGWQVLQGELRGPSP